MAAARATTGLHLSSASELQEPRPCVTDLSENYMVFGDRAWGLVARNYNDVTDVARKRLGEWGTSAEERMHENECFLSEYAPTSARYFCATQLVSAEEQHLSANFVLSRNVPALRIYDRGLYDKYNVIICISFSLNLHFHFKVNQYHSYDPRLSASSDFHYADGDTNLHTICRKSHGSWQWSYWANEPMGNRKGNQGTESHLSFFISIGRSDQELCVLHSFTENLQHNDLDSLPNRILSKTVKSENGYHLLTTRSPTSLSSVLKRFQPKTSGLRLPNPKALGCQWTLDPKANTKTFIPDATQCIARKYKEFSCCSHQCHTETHSNLSESDKQHLLEDKGKRPEPLPPNHFRKSENGDDDDKDEDNKEGCPTNQTFQHLPQDYKNWACPFAKFDPETYPNCTRQNEHKYPDRCRAGFENLSRLKQHLKRSHRNPSDQNRITDDQHDKIWIYLRNEEESWYFIYGVLFRNALGPISPYVAIFPRSAIDFSIQCFRDIGPNVILESVQETLEQDPLCFYVNNIPWPVLMEETCEAAFPECVNLLRTLMHYGEHLYNRTEIDLRGPRPPSGSYESRGPFTTADGENLMLTDPHTDIEALNWMPMTETVDQDFTTVADNPSSEFDASGLTCIPGNTMSTSEGAPPQGQWLGEPAYMNDTLFNIDVADFSAHWIDEFPTENERFQ